MKIEIVKTLGLCAFVICLAVSAIFLLPDEGLDSQSMPIQAAMYNLRSSLTGPFVWVVVGLALVLLACTMLVQSPESTVETIEETKTADRTPNLNNRCGFCGLSVAGHGKNCPGCGAPVNAL